VTAFEGEILDVDLACLTHPQAEQPEETREGVVDDTSGGALGDERTELHAIQTKGL